MHCPPPWTPPVVPAVPLEPEPEPEPEAGSLIRGIPSLRDYLQNFPFDRDPENEDEDWVGDPWDFASSAQRRLYREATEHTWADVCEGRGLRIRTRDQHGSTLSQLTPAEYADFRTEELRRYTYYCEEEGCDPWE